LDSRSVGLRRACGAISFDAVRTARLEALRGTRIDARRSAFDRAALSGLRNGGALRR
jgi:hypothetical protein